MLPHDGPRRMLGLGTTIRVRPGISPIIQADDASPFHGHGIFLRQVLTFFSKGLVCATDLRQ